MRRTLLCLVACLSLLTGCGVTSLPTTGPVEEVPANAQPRGVEIAPEPPQQGVAPSRLVEGFLQAMADPGADYSVARQYLTRAARDSWQPASGATIYSGNVLPREDRYLVVGERIGELDRLGRFTAAAEEFELDLALVQEEGEWRISEPPAGVLLSSYIFERYYVHTKVYFMRDHLVVPDLIHLPEALLTPSRLVEAQLAGPSEGIAASVTNALPSGAALADEGASVDPEGIVHVALRGLAPDLDEATRAAIGTQMVWSMTAIPRGTGLKITSGGTPLAIPGQNPDGVLTLESQQSAQALARSGTPDLFAVAGNTAGRFGANGEFLPMESSGVPVAEVAVSLDATRVAFIDQTRKSILIGPLGGRLETVEPPLEGIRNAQFMKDQLWVLGTDAKGTNRILRVDSRGVIREVDLGEVTAPVAAFSISQTGARLALVVGRPGNQRLWIGALSESGDADAWTVLLVRTAPGRPADIRSIDFSGETDLVLVQGEDGSRSVHVIPFDGSGLTDLGPLSGDPAQVAALPRPAGGVVAVLTAEGKVLRYEASTRWSQLAGTFEDVSFPG